MSESKKNYYEILGIPESAGRDAIRSAYRRLAFQLHPDRNNDPAAQQIFQNVIEAFSVLSDPESRREYDAILFSDSVVIASTLSSTLSASDLYESVAQQVGEQLTTSEREQYLNHLRRSRRRRTTSQTLIALVIILLLLLYGFQPLRISSQGIAPTTNTSGNANGSSGSTSTSGNKTGTSLNQKLIVIQSTTGLQGVPGPAGRDGRIGVDGVPGPAGANGADGVPGPAGANGAVGAPGPAGANGKDGAVGPAGPAGPTGAPGAQGAAGQAGTNGKDGKDGTGYTIKPNIAAATGYIGSCNQDLSDLTKSAGLDITITPFFSSLVPKGYKVRTINLKGFTPSCKGNLLQVNIELSSGETFECETTIPDPVALTDLVRLNASGCKNDGDTSRLDRILASELARIYLVVSG
jgi:hypothetical protein